jgi:hypothetical protein
MRKSISGGSIKARPGLAIKRRLAPIHPLLIKLSGRNSRVDSHCWLLLGGGGLRFSISISQHHLLGSPPALPTSPRDFGPSRTPPRTHTRARAPRATLARGTRSPRVPSSGLPRVQLAPDELELTLVLRLPSRGAPVAFPRAPEAFPASRRHRRHRRRRRRRRRHHLGGPTPPHLARATTDADADADTNSTANANANATANATTNATPGRRAADVTPSVNPRARIPEFSRIRAATSFAPPRGRCAIFFPKLRLVRAAGWRWWWRWRWRRRRRRRRLGWGAAAGTTSRAPAAEGLVDGLGSGGCAGGGKKTAAAPAPGFPLLLPVPAQRPAHRPHHRAHPPYGGTAHFLFAAIPEAGARDFDGARRSVATPRLAPSARGVGRRYARTLTRTRPHG